MGSPEEESPAVHHRLWILLLKMDIRFCVHQWLLGVAFLVLLHQCETSGPSSWHVCPQGQLYHQKNTRLGRPFATCCYPTRCGVGEEVIPCSANGTHDKCQTCGSHYNQSQRTSSFTMNKKCVSWPLDENCENQKGEKNFTDPRTRLCLCELERGLKFMFPESWNGAPKKAFCQPMKKCEPGYEPTWEGRCRPCEEGYFKATRSHNLCEPKTDCYLMGLNEISTSGATGDNNCSEPEVVSTPKPIPPTVKEPSEKGGDQNPPPPDSTEGKTAKPTTTTAVKVGESSGSMEESDDQEGGGLMLSVIVIVILLLVIIAIFVIVLVYRKRKGMSICSCVLFKTTDVEKCPGGTAVHGQYKNGSGNGVLENPLLVNTKGVNNNINGDLPQHHNSSNHRHPHAQYNGNTVHFSEGNEFDSQVFQNQKNSYQTRMSPPSRHGILRNGGDQPRQVVYGPYCNSRSQDASMDSIGREKLHANVNGFEANQDLGENDPLLVVEGTRSGPLPGHDLLPNTMYAASNSPPILYPTSGAPVHPNIQNAPVISHSVGNMNPNFTNSSGSSSPVPVQTSQPTHQVTFAPTADTVTFKRSISVIASPEGEVEEEELEANVPRFSQILPDGEDPPPSVKESNPILRMLHEKDLPMDSPQREMTHQMRLPSERLQHRPLQNPINTTQQRNQKYPHQGFPPALLRASSQPTPDDNVPDHHIMDLKEQQLANSFTSSLEDVWPAGTRSSSSNTRSDSSDTGVLKLEDFTAPSEQTDRKVCPGINKDSANSGAKNSNSKVPDFGIFTIGSGGSAQNTLERKRSGNNSLQRRRFLSGSNRQNSVERKRRSSGSDSAQNTLEFNKNGGDKQRSCLKPFGLEDGESEGKKLRLGRTVSFDAEEEKSSDSIGHDTKPKQVGDSLSSTESGQGPIVDTSVDLRKELRVSEEDYDGGVESDGVDTDPKQRQSDLDLSSLEDGQTSPLANNTYRRCQSESASSSTEAMQKPPPRSLSEEKPLKMERPIAKVKPMPASDNSVNKLVTDTAGEEETAATGNNSSGAGNILDYSSESSSGEENIPSESQQRQLRNEQEDDDSDEEDGRQ